MQLNWRPVAFSDGPEISTSLTGREIAKLMELAADKTVLEIGSAYGFSAIGMALVGAHVTAVDPHFALGSHTTMVNNLLSYGVTDLVDIKVGYSQDVLPWLTRAGKKFDLIWIDGDHEAPAVALDLRMALPLLADEGVLAFHDYDEVTCPGVRVALDAWIPPTNLVDTLALYGPEQWQAASA